MTFLSRDYSQDRVDTHITWLRKPHYHGVTCSASSSFIPFSSVVIIFMRLRYGYLTFHYEIYLTTLVVRSFYRLGQYISHHNLHETMTELDLLLLVSSRSRYYLNKYSDWTFRKKWENDSRTELKIGKCRMKKRGQWLYADFDSMNSK